MKSDMIKRVLKMLLCKHAYAVKHVITVDNRKVHILRCDKCGFITVRIVE